MEKDNKEFRNSILNENKILYCMKNRPCTETEMCWRFQCGDGWLNVLDDASKKLEALNYIFYPKFRTRIQADCVKEKYGTLRFYHSIVIDPPKLICIWHNFFQKMFDKINRIDFKLKRIVDREEYRSLEEEEIESKEKFDAEKEKHKNYLDVEFLEKNGKFIKRTIVHHCANIHYEPTRFRFIYSILKKRYIIEDFLEYLFKLKPSHKQICISRILDEKAKEIIKQAEDDCYNVCEDCGTYIGDSKYAPRCATHGYIRYICQKCADASRSDYSMNGEIWCEGHKISSEKEEKDENKD